jgi:branched-chain amino acid transport system permease protein
VSVARTAGHRKAALVQSLSTVERGDVVRGVGIAGFLAVVLFLIPLSGGDWIKTFTGVAIYSVVAAGLGILYGRVGMISLGQIALLALATWIGARLFYATSLPFPIILVLTGLITMAIGVFVGLPALRLSGLYLALITLMFAGAVTIILNVLQFPNGGHGFTGHLSALNVESIKNVRRPSIAVADTAYFRYVVIVCALMFGLALWHVATKPGHAWAAIRESEAAALAAGVNITVYKLWAFALASFMTGVGGGLLASHQGQPSTYGFTTQDSITLLATALIGGIYSLWGAIAAGVFIQLLPFLLKDQWGVNANFLIVIFGVGLLQVLLTAPGGLVQQFPKDMANLGRLILRLVTRIRAKTQTA